MAVSRRRLMRLGVTGSITLLVGASLTSADRYSAPRWRGGDPFSLGVASGDPTPDGVVLWTRLAPDPFAPDGLGGMPQAPVTVEYEVAHDEAFHHIARRGAAVATQNLAHSVHPEVSGLEPNRWYFYRFRAGTALSAVGRTRTAPMAGAPVSRMRFAFASCQSWSSGYYTAYDHMSSEDLDLVVHLGDYIYERGWTNGRIGAPTPPLMVPEAVDLRGYRLRYAQAKAEVPLQTAHAAFPWLVTVDDHEIDNNWAGSSPGLGFDIYRIPAVFRHRKVAAFQAMYEHQPLRLAQMPSGPSALLHRRYAFGDLAEVTMLDTRQYRTRQACDGEVTADCPARSDPNRTILGAPQRDWLIDGFRTSSGRWQILGNQVGMSRLDSDPGPDTALSTDAWDGYLADRAAVLGAAADLRVRNLVVITGDRHQNHVADLRRDHGDLESSIVATEFTGTSITSGGNGTDMTDVGRRMVAANPDLKFFNSQRGYVRVELDHHLLRSDFRTVPYVNRRGAPVSTRATFAIHDGIPGAVELSRRPPSPDSNPDLGHSAERPAGR